MTSEHPFQPSSLQFPSDKSERISQRELKNYSLKKNRKLFFLISNYWLITEKHYIYTHFMYVLPVLVLF